MCVLSQKAYWSWLHENNLGGLKSFSNRLCIKKSQNFIFSCFTRIIEYNQKELKKHIFKKEGWNKARWQFPWFSSSEKRTDWWCLRCKNFCNEKNIYNNNPYRRNPSCIFVLADYQPLIPKSSEDGTGLEWTGFWRQGKLCPGHYRWSSLKLIFIFLKIENL